MGDAAAVPPPVVPSSPSQRPPSLGGDAAFIAAGLPIPVVNDLEQECFVFEKKAYSDVIWQASGTPCFSAA